MKQIPGTTKYFASEDGQIFSTYFGKLHLLKPKVERGYPIVTLVEPYKRNWFVHQLVAAAFLGERPEGFITCHKDGNRNRASLTEEQVRQIRTLSAMTDMTRAEIAAEVGTTLSIVKAVRGRRTYEWVR